METLSPTVDKNFCDVIQRLQSAEKLIGYIDAITDVRLLLRDKGISIPEIHDLHIIYENTLRSSDNE